MVKHFNACKATLDIYMPQKMSRFPFICIVAKGNHLHHPPYPTRLPKDVADDVVAAIRGGDVLSLTGRKLQICFAYAEYMLTLI